MNDQQLTYYLNHGGMRCPFCHSSNITTVGPIETRELDAYQSVKCHICNKKWTDFFKLSSAEEDTE